jgi:hypothetical protein
LAPLPAAVAEEVPIQIHPRRTRRPSVSAHTGARGQIRKRAVPVVVIEVIAPIPGDIDVFESIVVVVANGHAHADSDASASDSLWHFLPMGNQQSNIENLLTDQAAGITNTSTASAAQAVQWADNAPAITSGVLPALRRQLLDQERE